MSIPDPAAADPAHPLDALAHLVEGAIERLVRLDPASAATLQRLEGRQLRLRLRGATRGLRLRIRDGRMRPVPDHDGEADLALSVEPSALLAWLAKPERDRGLPPGVRIDGELELARLLEQALRDFDPDWELPFVDLFGSSLGPQLARGLAGGAGWLHRQLREFAGASAEYLTEETRLVTARAELDRFNAQVDRLRDDVERLAARIARLDQERTQA